MRRVALAGLLVARAAFADPAEDAAKLFEEGRGLAKAGDFNGACERFGRAHELDPGIGIELNLADCDEHLGRIVLAFRLFDHAAATATAAGNEAQAKLARARADVLAARLGTVVVNLPDPLAPGLELTIDGRKEQPAAEVREIVDPGIVEVKVTMPGRPPFSQSAHAAAGGTAVVFVPGNNPTPPDVPVAPLTERRKSRVRVAYYVGGGAVALAATSVVLGLVAKSKYDAPISNHECTDAGCSQQGFDAQTSARRLSDVATGFGIGAAAAAVGAAVVFVTAPRDSVTVSVSATGVAISGQF